MRPLPFPRRMTRCLALCQAALATLTTLACQPSTKWNDAFHRSQGWWYADGGSTAELPGGKTVWLFGDSWVKNARALLSNSMAVQESPLGRAPEEGDIRFFARDVEGRVVDVTTVGNPAARSWVEPDHGEGPPRTWMWPSAALAVDGKLLAAYAEIGCVRGEYPTCRGWLPNMGFTGHSMLEVDNPNDDPERWVGRTVPLLDREGRTPSAHRLHWGSALLTEHGWVYVFGTSLDSKSEAKDLKVARATPPDVTHYERWQFLTRAGWEMIPTGPMPDELETLARDAATEISVQRVTRHGRTMLLLVQVDPRSQSIVVRSAKADTIESARWAGPAAGPGVRRFSLPEIDPDTAGGMSWSGHVHDGRSSRPDSLLVSYFSERMHSLRFVELSLNEAAP